jgi:RNA polymerase sigma-70 factor (ECF subfamily)
MNHANDPAAWLDEHGDALFSYAMMRLRSEAAAEDLVQETLLAGWQAFAQFSGQSTIKTWLIGIMKHKLVDYFRKQRFSDTSLDEFADQDELFAQQFDESGHWRTKLTEWLTPDKALANEQFWQVFYWCLARLPDNMADIFVLRMLEGLSSEECCQALNIATTNQLCVALSRSRMKLRHCLTANWFGGGEANAFV